MGKNLSDLFSESQEVDIKQQPIVKLMKAYHKMFQKKPSRMPVSITESLPLMTDCIHSIHSYLIVGSKIKMSSLIKLDNRNILAHTLVTFLALLELGRLGIVSLEQEQNDISISVKRQFNNENFSFIQEIEGTTI